MKRYKVQWAYAEDIGSPVILNDEAKAADKVAYLLGTWLRRNWEAVLSMKRDVAHNHPEFIKGLAYLHETVPKLIAEGSVWDAFDLWEDFYARFENDFGYPLYVKIGAVFVEGSTKTGLKNRIPLLERTDVPPLIKYQEQWEGEGEEKGKIPTVIYDRLENKKAKLLEEILPVIGREAAQKGIPITIQEVLMAAIETEKSLHASRKYAYQDEETERRFLAALREGILKRVFPQSPSQELFKNGGSMGAMTIWQVQYADLGGMMHAGRHTNEERAKFQAQEYLGYLIRHLGVHSDTEAHVGRNKKYVKEARELIQHLHYLIDNDMIWAAYLDYKSFENKWNSHFQPFSLQMSIGSMRVIPTPESE